MGALSDAVSSVPAAVGDVTDPLKKTHPEWADPELDRLDADIYFHRFHRSLGIHLTMRCPLRCAHCSVDSGPEQNESLDEALLLTRLEDMGADGRIRRLSLSGGEPFLMRSTLLGVLKIAERHRIATVINTASHWAGTPERARNTLAGFPDVAEIALSADEYHEPFVPLENIRHAAEAALARGLVTSLVIRTWTGEEDPFIGRLRMVLGEAVWAGAKLDIATIQHVGRGAELGRREPALPVTPDGVQDGPCTMANQPVIDSDGTVLACCNTAGARTTPLLHLGSLTDDSLPAVTARADRNRVLQAIRVWGPAALRDLLVEAGLEHKLARSYESDSICHLCTDIGAKPDLVAALEGLLAEPDRIAELAAARLLRYGEPSPDLVEDTELSGALAP